MSLRCTAISQGKFVANYNCTKSKSLNYSYN